MAHDPYQAPASEPARPPVTLDPAVVAALPWRSRTPPRLRLVCAVALPTLALVALALGGWSTAFALTAAQRSVARSIVILLAPPTAMLFAAALRAERAIRARRSSRLAPIFATPAQDGLVAVTLPGFWGLVSLGLNLVPHGLAPLGLGIFLLFQFFAFGLGFAARQGILLAAVPPEPRAAIVTFLGIAGPTLVAVAVAIGSREWVLRSYRDRGYIELPAL